MAVSHFKTANSTEGNTRLKQRLRAVLAAIETYAQEWEVTNSLKDGADVGDDFRAYYGFDAGTNIASIKAEVDAVKGHLDNATAAVRQLNAWLS